jgi:pyridoxine kinase
MRVLSVSSQVVWGPVGNSAAVPALQSAGHEVLALPSVILSNHPGHGTPAGLRMPAADMAQMLQSLEALGALNGLDAVLTGYFASADQVHEVAALLRRARADYVLVDPVMGDHGRLYVAEEVAAAIRTQLLPCATCIAPNRFELMLLSGQPVEDQESATAAARSLAIPEVLATSIPAPGGQLATLVVTATDVFTRLIPQRPGVPHGTGDFLSGLYLAARLRLPPHEALEAAMAVLERAIVRSEGTAVLDVAGALHNA